MSKPPVVIVTRPSPMGEALCDELNQLGYQAEHCPLIGFAPDQHYSAAQQLQLLQQHQLWIFISKQAVDYSLGQLPSEQLARLSATTIIAVGKATQAALKGYGFDAKLPATPDSEGILALIDELQLPDQHAILLVRGNRGRGLLEQQLAHPYQLQVMPVYRRVELPAKLPVSAVPPVSSPLACIVTSGQLLELSDKLLLTAGISPQQVAMISGSARISDLARQKGYTNCYTANDASNPELVNACLTWHQPLEN